MPRRALLPVLAVLLVTALAAPAAPARIACVGDSITAGYGLKDPARDAWPAVLARLLGPDFDVRNFGVSATTLLRHGNYPYWDRPAFAEAGACAPQIVIIKLGTNDTKPANWDAHAGEFAADAAALVAHFAGLPSKPAVWICLPAPIFANKFTIEEANAAQVRKILRAVAAEHHVPVIDPGPALAGHPEYFPDGVHPTAAGAAVLAQVVADALRAAPIAATAAGGGR